MQSTLHGAPRCGVEIVTIALFATVNRPWMLKLPAAATRVAANGVKRGE
jgi:hypothetical protein